MIGPILAIPRRTERLSSRPAIIVIALVALLLTQVAMLVFSSPRLSPSFSTEPTVAAAEFLLSDVRGLSGSKRRYIQSFEIRTGVGIKAGADELLEVRLQSASCGCLAFSIDGRSLNMGSTLDVQSRGSPVLSATAPIRNSIGSDVARFTLVIRQKRSSAIDWRQEYEIRTTVKPDLICTPPILRLEPLKVGEKTRPTVIHVDHFVHARDSNETVPEVFFESKADVPSLDIGAVKRIKSEKLPNSDLVRNSYDVLVRYDSNALAALGKGNGDTNRSPCLQVLIRLSDGNPIQECVPLLVAFQGD